MLKDKDEELKRHREEKELIMDKLKQLEAQAVQGGGKENSEHAKKYK